MDDFDKLKAQKDAIEKRSETIFVVSGESGDYDDRTEWFVAWCATESEAKKLVELCAADDAALRDGERFDCIIHDEVKRRLLPRDPHWRSIGNSGVRYVHFPLTKWEGSGCRHVGEIHACTMCKRKWCATCETAIVEAALIAAFHVCKGCR